MSRHRNVRTMNMDDFEDEDDIYGHSLEDDCISPSDTKWIYDRDKNRQTMSEFFSKHDDIEEEGDMDVDHHTPKKHHERRDSENFQLPDLNDEDKARLLSCMEEIRSVVGETVTDRQMVDAIMKHNYDCNMALDEVLNASTTPPVPRTIVIKESTPTPIEKDSNLSNLAKKPHFNLPKVSFSTKNSCSDLSELVKQRLKENENKMANLSIDTKSTTNNSNNFTNLSDFAKFHLKSSSNLPHSLGSGKKFNIPKPFEGDSSVPKLKVPVEKTCNKDEDLKENWIIDLKSALINDKTVECSVIAKTSKDPEEPVHYRFVDCDIMPEKPIIDEYCEIDISAISNKNFQLNSKNPSIFGKLICKKYRPRKIANIKLGFAVQNVITPFDFKTKSPDDVILEHMRKFKR